MTTPATSPVGFAAAHGCAHSSYNGASDADSAAVRSGVGGIRHVVNESGGICSFWATKRVIDRHGKDGVVRLFADVCMEDEDLYRFQREATEYFGVPLTRISLEKTPWELFEQQGMIGNSRSPLCSVMLKRELLDRWMRANTLELTTTLYIGIDWTEEHRLRDLRQRKPTWRIEAPMTEEPYWDKCKMLEELKRIGIEPPGSTSSDTRTTTAAGSA